MDWNKELAPGPLELGFDYYFGVPILNSHPPLFMWRTIMWWVMIPTTRL